VTDRHTDRQTPLDSIVRADAQHHAAKTVLQRLVLDSANLVCMPLQGAATWLI